MILIVTFHSLPFFLKNIDVMQRRCFSFCIDVLTLNKNSSKDGKMLTIKPDSEKITFYFFKCIDLVNLKLLPKLFSKYITDAFKVMPNTKH